MAIIRKFEFTDVKQVAHIESEVFKSDVFSADMFSKLLNNNNNYSLVTEDKNKNIIAYINASVVLDEAEILTFATKLESRRKGVGLSLLLKFLKKLKQKGFKKVSLEVRASNTAAKKLYEKAGGKLLGTRKNYYNTSKKSKKEDAAIYCFKLKK